MRFIIVLGMVSMLGIGTAYSQSRVNFSIYTTGQPSAQQRTAPPSYAAYLSMDTVQHRSAAGIGMVIHIINTGERSVTVFNPLETLQLVIFNAAREKIQIPHVPHVLFDGPEHAKREEVYQIAGYTINNKAIGEAAPDKITLPAKGHCEVSVFIPRVLAGPENAQTTQPRVAVPPGKYEFFITLSVSDLQSNTILQAGPISINYH